jgi:hypothetical protein
MRSKALFEYSIEIYDPAEIYDPSQGGSGVRERANGIWASIWCGHP